MEAMQPDGGRRRGREGGVVKAKLPQLLWWGRYRGKTLRVVHVSNDPDPKVGPIVCVEEMSRDKLGQDRWVDVLDGENPQYELRQDAVDVALVAIVNKTRGMNKA